jgi:uncharacterized membrane protein YcaP (DUF421 family)
MSSSRWESLGRTRAAGIVACIGLILRLRISGKRKRLQRNAFDLIVAVALRATSATVIRSKSVTHDEVMSLLQHRLPVIYSRAR